MLKNSNGNPWRQRKCLSPEEVEGRKRMGSYCGNNGFFHIEVLFYLPTSNCSVSMGWGFLSHNLVMQIFPFIVRFPRKIVLKVGWGTMKTEKYRFLQFPVHIRCHFASCLPTSCHKWAFCGLCSRHFSTVPLYYSGTLRAFSGGACQNRVPEPL